MDRDTLTYGELFEGLDPAPAFVAELEKLGLLRVVASDGRGAPLYGREARAQLEKVLALVELGYRPRDIAAIARKVGLPTPRRRLFRRRPVYVRLPELASRSGVSEDLLDRWRLAGILEPSMVTDAGEHLFASAVVNTARRLADLVEFGLSDEEIAAWTRLARELDGLDVASWSRPETPPTVEELAAAGELVAGARESLTRLRGRLDGLRDGLRRWDKVCAIYERRVARLQRTLARPDGGPGGRIRRRRRAKTRRHPVTHVPEG